MVQVLINDYGLLYYLFALGNYAYAVVLSTCIKVAQNSSCMASS